MTTGCQLHGGRVRPGVGQGIPEGIGYIQRGESMSMMHVMYLHPPREQTGTYENITFP